MHLNFDYHAICQECHIVTSLISAPILQVRTVGQGGVVLEEYESGHYYEYCDLPVHLPAPEGEDKVPASHNLLDLLSKFNTTDEVRAVLKTVAVAITLFATKAEI